MMAAKPLALKREPVRRTSRAGLFTSVAEVLVDHGLGHLDQSFTYGIPAKLIDSINIGSLVKVPFNRNELEGVVVGKRVNESGTFKPVIGVIRQFAYTESAIALAREVAKRYATSVLRILKLFVKLRFEGEYSAPQKSGTARIQRRFFPESQNTISDLISRLRTVQGSVLIFVPSAREATWLCDELKETLGSRVLHIDEWHKSSIDQKSSKIVIGMRGMIFTQINDLTELIVFNDSSELYWDQRSPFWNLRDVALIRSRLESLSLLFISGAPSLEVARLGETKYFTVEKPQRQLFKRRSFATDPDTYHHTVRAGLDKGSVLVSVASKNYANSLLCKRCKTIPKCHCGFPLKMLRKESASCSMCGESTSTLRCRECGSVEIIILGKGIERINEEFGRTFPNIPIVNVTAEKEFSGNAERSIVISTPGVEPYSLGYGGVVLLDGLARVSRATLRSEEYLLNHWHRLVALALEDASIYISLPNSHRIAQSLISNNPLKASKIALEERRTINLPPWYRVIRVKGDSLSALASQLAQDFKDIELSKVSKSNELVIRARVEIAQDVVSALSILQKYRSATGKRLLSLEIDPYDL